MQILDRYILRTILGAIALVLLVMLSLDAISRVLEEIPNIQNQYTFAEVLIFTLLSLPVRLYEYLPFCAMVGCLVGLGVLANNSELIVMRSVGVSILRLIWAVMKPAMVVVLIGILIGEFVAPTTTKLAIGRQELLLYGEDTTISYRGLWNREGNQYMHFNVVEPGGVLHGVTVYEFDEQHELQRAFFAERANYREQYWQLEQVVGTRFVGNKAYTENFERVNWQMALTPELLNIVVLQPDDLSLRKLWRYGNYLDKQGLNSKLYWLAFWRKCFHPITTAGLVLVAISFIFGPLRSVTMGFRVFSGIIIGIVFRTSQDLLAPASLVFGFQPFIAILIPNLICYLAGMILLLRVR